MFRRRISATCNCPWHPFPVRMKYAGTTRWRGRLVHMMYCPVCGCRRLYDYVTAWRYRRVA